MALSPGTRLGPYEILASIGAGGMGEVYKALDTRLNRTVAIKVSSARFSERFEREARAVAALNHPHICQLYDVGPDYLVMEYVDGKPVSGPLPLQAVLRSAIQIAGALEAAHRHGIVHRDLKPANILLAQSGIKLLDFGLAKLTRQAPATESTVTESLTQKNTILGTLQYMSPEQLQGKDADSRSDIFSFGCVLYELVTGRRAFAGDNTASIITAVMSAEPLAPPIDTPPALVHLIRSCIAKDPDARRQTIHDVLLDLEWIAASRLQPADDKLRTRTRLPRIVAGTVLILAVLSVLSLWKRRERPRIMRLQLETPGVGLNLLNVPVLSPDGTRVVFNGTDTKRVERIWVRAIASFEPQAIPGTEGGSNPFWSPDGKQIGFAANGNLLRTDLQGGTPQLICNGVGGQWRNTVPSWGPAGVILFDANRVIQQVSALGGEARPVTRLDTSRDEIKHGWPQFLPGGRHFLYHAVSRKPENSGIYVASLDPAPSVRITSSTLPAVYVDPGLLLAMRGRTLSVQRFDWKHARLEGEPISLSEQVNTFDNSFYPLACFSVSRNILAYRPGGQPISQLAWFDRNGKRQQNLGGPDYYTNPFLSPDGKRVVVAKTDPHTGMRDLWLLDATGGSLQLTTDPKDDLNPLWSPDGRHIAFSSNRQGVRDVFIKPANGTGGEELLFASTSDKSVVDWSPDGKFVLYEAADSIWAVPAQGPRKPFQVLSAGAPITNAEVSPDSKWIAYQLQSPERSEIFITSFPVAGTRWQISTEGGWEPRWRADGRELYYSFENKLMAVDIKLTAGRVEYGPPRMLFQAPFTWELRRNRFVATTDGQRFLINTLGQDDAPSRQSRIHIVVNWTTGLEK